MSATYNRPQGITELERQELIRTLFESYSNPDFDINLPPITIIQELINRPELTSEAIAYELNALMMSLPLELLAAEGLHAIVYMILKEFQNEISPERAQLIYHIVFQPVLPEDNHLDTWKELHRPLRSEQAEDALGVIEDAEQAGRSALIYADAPMNSAKTYFKEQLVAKLRAKGYNVVDYVFEYMVDTGGQSRISDLPEGYRPQGFILSPENYDAQLQRALSQKKEGMPNAIAIDEFTFVADDDKVLFNKFVGELRANGFHVILVGLGSDYLARTLKLAEGIHELDHSDPHIRRYDCRSFSILQGDDVFVEPQADKTARYVVYQNGDNSLHYVTDIHQLPLIMNGDDPRVRYIPVRHGDHVDAYIDQPQIRAAMAVRHDKFGNARQVDLKQKLVEHHGALMAQSKES